MPKTRLGTTENTFLAALVNRLIQVVGIILVSAFGLALARRAYQSLYWEATHFSHVIYSLGEITLNVIMTGIVVLGAYGGHKLCKKIRDWIVTNHAAMVAVSVLNPILGIAAWAVIIWVACMLAWVAVSG